MGLKLLLGSSQGSVTHHALMRERVKGWFILSTRQPLKGSCGGAKARGVARARTRAPRGDTPPGLSTASVAARRGLRSEHPRLPRPQAAAPAILAPAGRTEADRQQEATWPRRSTAGGRPLPRGSATATPLLPSRLLPPGARRPSAHSGQPPPSSGAPGAPGQTPPAPRLPT